MADYTQAASTLLTHQHLTAADTRAGQSVEGDEVDVRTYISARIYAYQAIIEASPAANNPPVQIQIQVRWSTGANVDEDWITVARFVGSTEVSATVNIDATEPVGETALSVGASPVTGFLPGAFLYIDDATATVDGEWAQVAHTSASVLSLVSGLANAKASGDDCWANAQCESAVIDLSGVSYIRAIFQHGENVGAGADMAFKCEMIAATDFV